LPHCWISKLNRLVSVSTEEQRHQLLAFTCRRFNISRVTLDAFLATLPKPDDTALAVFADSLKRPPGYTLQPGSNLGYAAGYPIVIGDAAMSDLPAPVLAATLPANLQVRDAERVAYYTRRFRAPGTIANWSSTWRSILLYCARYGYEPYPMTWDVAASFISDMADSGYVFGSISSARYAIRALHRLGNALDPTADPRFVRVLQGIGRTLGTECQRQKAAVMLDQLRAMHAHAKATNTLASLQDWTVLSVGFFGALRRSELVALDVDDITFGDTDTYVHIRRSKTEQFRAVELPLLRRDDELCPVSALGRWLRALPDCEGPVFRTTRRGQLRKTRMADRTVCRIVQRYCSQLGLDPSKFGAHSLRAGYVTEEIEHGTPDMKVAIHTRHRDFDSLLRYFRPNRSRRNLTQGVLT
jgi:integrase